VGGGVISGKKLLFREWRVGGLMWGGSRWCVCGGHARWRGVGGIVGLGVSLGVWRDSVWGVALFLFWWGISGKSDRIPLIMA